MLRLLLLLFLLFSVLLLLLLGDAANLGGLYKDVNVWKSDFFFACLKVALLF